MTLFKNGCDNRVTSILSIYSFIGHSEIELATWTPILKDTGAQTNISCQIGSEEDTGFN